MSETILHQSEYTKSDRRAAEMVGRTPYTIESVFGMVKTETRPPDRERQGPPAFNPAPDQDQHLDRDSCGTSRGEFVPNLARGSSASIGATKQHERSERKGER
jgi:hypothetical protein